MLLMMMAVLCREMGRRSKGKRKGKGEGEGSASKVVKKKKRRRTPVMTTKGIQRVSHFEGKYLSEGRVFVANLGDDDNGGTTSFALSDGLRFRRRGDGGAADGDGDGDGGDGDGDDGDGDDGGDDGLRHGELQEPLPIK